METEKDSTFLDSFRETRFIIKSKKELKARLMQFRIYVSLLHFLFIAIFSISIVSFNIYLFFISFLKYLILYSLTLSTIYLLIVNQETAEKWHERSTRNTNLKGKIFALLIEGTILLALSLLMFGIVYLSGTYNKVDQMDLDFGSNVISRLFAPVSIEAVFYALTIAFLILSYFTSIFWFSARCIKCTSYFSRKGLLNTNSKSMYVGLIINWIILGILLPIFLDLGYFFAKSYWLIHISYPLKEIYEQNPYLPLLIQLVVIVLLNFYYVIDGVVANRKKTKTIRCQDWGGL